MAGKISEISLKTMFEYTGYGCNYVMDIENTAPGEEPKATIKVCSDPGRQLLFSYASRDGLNLTGKAGGVIEKNILGKLLALPKNDIEKMMEFFQQYGFFLPLSKDEYSSIGAEDLLTVVNRIKTTVRLYNSINKKDYKGVLLATAFLLYSPVVSMNTPEDKFSTCEHAFSRLVRTYNLFPDLSTDPEVFNKGTYTVPDTFLGQDNHIDIEFYNKIRSGADTIIKGSKDPSFKNLTALYVGCRDVGEETRMLIDFFFHFQTEVAVFKEISYGSINPYSHIDESAFSDNIKAGLLKIARIVVAEEINYNIRGIHPKYDGGRLSASWQVDTLMQALYFSIFYMSTGQIYKECENPNCERDKYFLVEATRVNKKYCCPQCANAAAAQRYRNRQLGK